MIYVALAAFALVAYIAAVHRANSLRYPHIDDVLAALAAEEKNRETGPTVAAWNDPAE